MYNSNQGSSHFKAYKNIKEMRSSSLLKIVYIIFKKNISSSVFRLNLNHEIRDQFLIKIE